MFLFLTNVRWPARQLVVVGLLAALMRPSLHPQQTVVPVASGATAENSATLELLVTRIEQLVARVQQREEERQQSGSIGIAPLPDGTALPHSTPAEPTHAAEPTRTTAEPAVKDSLTASAAVDAQLATQAAA